MVHKLFMRVGIVLMAAGLVGLLVSGGCQEPPPAPKAEEKVILEMTMYPIEGEDGEYMLEYRESSHGPVIRREILKKDGTRHPVGPVGLVHKDKK